MRCQQCNAALGCGCQKRIASNGVSVCANCIMNYEKQLVNKRNALANPGPIRPQ